MAELQVDDMTAAFVRARAEGVGVSEREWLATHFRTIALRESADAHAAWYAARPGLLEAEVANAQAANAEADAARGRLGP